MKRQDSLRISLVLVAFVAVHMISDEEAIADYVFGKAVNLGPVINSRYPDAWWGGSISADGLSLYFDSQRPGGYGGDDLWVTTRATVSDPWGPPVNLGGTVNSSASDGCPSISADGLELYFNSMCPGGSGGSHGGDLWMTTRTTLSSPWGKPVWLGPILNTQDDDVTPSISADGLSLFFGSGRPSTTGGIWNIWMSTRPTKQIAWGTPVNLGIAGSEFNPCISADGRLLFFTRGDPGPAPLTDIWVTTRTSTSDKWSEPIDLGPSVNSPPADWPTGISADGSILYFASTRPGGIGADDLWQASITPIVDFNGDGVVDISDLVKLIEHWGTNETLCDIGPMLWGSGVVDAADLEVLMRSWQQEVLPVSMIAYWKLDEVEGVVAVDSVGISDAVLVGDPIWQPTGGELGGVLQLDGVDDCVTTEFVRDPSEGLFSVLAWVKGGAPGQVILSQVNGANWLMAGASDGGLTTELKSSGRSGKALKSVASITDNAWHHVGFVWDGSNRTLYVDGAEVAKDTQTGLVGSAGGLYLGAGRTIAPGSFWSGLIDDVRIYDAALSAEKIAALLE